MNKNTITATSLAITLSLTALGSAIASNTGISQDLPELTNDKPGDTAKPAPSKPKTAPKKDQADKEKGGASACAGDKSVPRK